MDDNPQELEAPDLSVFELVDDDGTAFWYICVHEGEVSRYHEKCNYIDLGMVAHNPLAWSVRCMGPKETVSVDGESHTTKDWVMIKKQSKEKFPYYLATSDF